MSDRVNRILAALSGIGGSLILTLSFRMNPAPPTGLTTAQLGDFAVQHNTLIVLGGWTQGIGSLLIVLFALALVHFAGATRSYAGWVTLLAGAAILTASLLEITFYLAVAQAAVTGDTVTGLTSGALIKAVQHVFLIAPALLLPLGFVLLTSNTLPRLFAYSALLLGIFLQIGGLLGLFSLLQPVVDFVLIVQNVWLIAAGVALLVRPTALKTAVATR